MLTIGEFSRLTQVPAKTLRYYGQIGLFQPAQVDRFTQYRYYSME
ncbi:MAG: MerR family DNA-binding transcriptional regulator, partial [Anaerolineae bacterium]|nr:MerR family DNA-binding transcriptional regulator [Anaerolineae bacterium]